MELPRKRLCWIALSLALIYAATLFLTFRTPFRWHVALTPDWRISTAEAMEFDVGGLQVKTRTTHHVGPLAIFATREWTQQQAHREIGTGLRELSGGRP